MRGEEKKKRNDGQTLWYDQLLSDGENNPRLSVSLIRRPRENGGTNVRVAAGRCAKPLVPRLPTPTGDSSGGRGHPRTAGQSTVPTPRAAADGFTEEGDSVTGRSSSPAQDPGKTVISPREAGRRRGGGPQNRGSRKFFAQLRENDPLESTKPAPGGRKFCTFLIHRKQIFHLKS